MTWIRHRRKHLPCGAGQRDPRMLARTRMKAKREELAEALDGMIDDHHGELAGMLLDLWGSNPRRRL